MIKIRKANRKDIPDIIKLWCEFMDFHEKYDSYYMRSPRGHLKFKKFIDNQISSRKSLVLVAISENIICGYLLAMIENKSPVFKVRRYGLISDVAVSSIFRREGIGEKLCLESYEWFKKHKINRIELNVATTNPVSMNFWSKLGFNSYCESRFIEI